MIIYVDKKNLTMKLLDDPTAEMKQSEIIILGKRRDRYTVKGAWCEDLEEAQEQLRKAISARVIETQTEIQVLQGYIDNELQCKEKDEMAAINSLIRKNNNSIFN